MKKEMFLLALVCFFFNGCTKNTDEIVTAAKQKPSDNYTCFVLSLPDSCNCLKNGKYIMPLDHSEVTEGAYSSLSLNFNSVLESDQTVYFDLMLPATEKFSVFVGMCTPLGCILDCEKPESSFSISEDEYTNLKTLYGDPLSPSMTVTIVKGVDTLEKVVFDKFRIAIDSFSVESTLVTLRSSHVELSSSSDPELRLEGEIYISGQEPAQTMVEQ
ncbi:hypothetical protein JXA84_02385 [candidate division WOR-3 bacterium]|nr:hypothetical protein [candidate division WOR-3 bacterium]